MMNPREKCCSTFLFLLGILLLIIGIVIMALMPTLTKKVVDEQVPLTENSFAERTWQDPPYKITMQIWIFNVTNPLEVIHESAKPALVQKGPYGYKESQQKKQVVFQEDNTISYVNQKTYFFDPTLSCSTCRQDDVFTVPNVPYLAALPVVDQLADIKGLGPLLKIGGKAALLGMGEQLFVGNITAAQFLFDGYDDEIFNLLDKLQPGKAPKRMGLFYGKNNTDDGVYVIASGNGNASNMGRIITWQGHPNLSFTGWWNSTDADGINGTDGTVYGPFVKRTDTLYAFITDICRSVYLTYYADVDIDGIKAYRFRLAKECFDAYAPENQGFCWPMKDPIYSTDIQPQLWGGWCLPTGMNDISKCQYGSPVVTSMPQFVDSPEEVRKSVTGLFPESDDYLSFVDIEPTSGVLMTGARLIQLNVIMQPDPADLLTKNMKPVIVPLAWINETVAIDPATRDFVYQNVVVMSESAYIAAFAAMGVGAVWIVCVAVGWAVSRYSAKHQRRQFLKLND